VPVRQRGRSSGKSVPGYGRNSVKERTRRGGNGRKEIGGRGRGGLGKRGSAGQRRGCEGDLVLDHDQEVGTVGDDDDNFLWLQLLSPVT